MKTEKVSVNLSPVELGQIDCLVEHGLFDSRSDFIRTSARKHLENHSSEFEKFLKPEPADKEDSGISYAFSLGIIGFSKNEILKYIKSGKKLKIRVIGLLKFSNGITKEEIKQVVLSCKVYGKLVAGNEVKEALREIEEM